MFATVVDASAAFQAVHADVASERLGGSARATWIGGIGLDASNASDADPRATPFLCNGLASCVTKASTTAFN